ncbi:hypothetical protein BUALT_Bualt14G0060800 [Buddleja alternifolia]|uniref:RRM domain-containing protein n=1 Tax=Buddleja alternifolia TaxID=168488 RepID=A0AAV6WSJ0_9LAMI|nr:hypothetical protein BUALT_Bualt14G0060800 [Buddleja alternifolia]
MTKTRRHKEKHGSYNEVSQDDFLEGTSARTRPFSYDDIMLNRKNRGDTATEVAFGPGEADVALAQHNIEKAYNSPDCHRQINKDSGSMDIRHSSKDPDKISSRRKGITNSSAKSSKLVQDKDEGSRNPDLKLKSIVTKNVNSNTVAERKYEKDRHSNRKRDVFLSVDSDYGSDKRRARDSIKNDRLSERGRGKSEKDRNQPFDEDRQVYRKRRTDGRLSSDSENEYKKRNARDVMQTDKLTDRGRDKSEKEKSYKRHTEEDKTRGRSTVKNHDSEKKGSELTRAYLEESKAKRKRSLSKDHDKERGRRSPSHSPKAHKHTSKDKREHGELSSHSTKDRSGREHSEVDKKRISSNGSSSHHRQNTGSSSGLGGYSPRKRKTDAAAKTPSPARRSPERKTAGWDLEPVEKESGIAGSTLSNLHTTSQNLSLDIKEIPSVTPVLPSMVKPIGSSHHTLSSQMHGIESVQLTQATRPMRRLYVENLPSSASEKDLLECINKYLMSSGVNYIQGTQPCISCIIHKEKGQALLEFLTPEYASAALSLDGIPFSGSNLKLRRPKDYTNITFLRYIVVINHVAGFQTVAIFMQTGLPDKLVVAVDSTSSIVEDSPHKIFVGGISNLISSDMLLEIARAFGPVKAYHYEFNADMNEPCAFLEYVDHSVTSKACAGINGIRLGGQVVTAVFATPDAVLENIPKPPFYGIPEHAKSLLEKPTTVLKLKNVLDPEGLLSLSESELEEILEDIRLECSRFGTVKSVDIVKPKKSFDAVQAHDVNNTNASTDNRSYTTDQLGGSLNEFVELDTSEPLATLNDLEMENNSQTVQDNDNNVSDNPMSIEICKPLSDDENISIKDPSSLEKSGGFTDELAKQQNASANELEINDNIAGSISAEVENKLDENDAKSVELDSEEKKELDEKCDKNDISADLDEVFEAGSVFVEYRRAEAACMAAHCLHGRSFDGRVVSVGYVGHDIYCTRFK